MSKSESNTAEPRVLNRRRDGTPDDEQTIKSGWRFWLWVAILLPGALYLWARDVINGR